MTQLKRIFFLIAVILMAAPLGAREARPALIYDLPQTEISRIHDLDPASLLSLDQMEKIRTTRFDGDTFKVLIVLIDWSNRPGSYSLETFDSMMFSRNIWPGGSVADYFYETSYGQLNMIGDCIGWHDAGMYNSNFWFGDIVDELDATVDFSQYDANEDGFVDAILFIRSGNGEEDSGNPDDIWSYAVSYGGDGLPTNDGVSVNRWCTVPETWPLRNPINPTLFSGVDTLNRIRVACHELTHNLGAPDLYDYDAKLDTMTYITPGDDNDHPLVDWCVMGYGGYGIMAIGSMTPSHHCGWMKKDLGWTEPVVVSGATQQLVLYDIEDHKDSSLFMVPIDMAEGEYFLLEFRNPNATGIFDKVDSDFSCYLWPDLTYGGDVLDRGLLITHIHDSLTTDHYRMNSGTPDHEHYSVIVEDAGYNALYDYSNNPEGRVSDSAQWWYPYETRLGALYNPDLPGQTEFGPTTVPNSDGYSGPTGITITADSIVGELMYVTVAYPIEDDSDGDGIITADDNCPDTYNPDQENADGDEYGDFCDNCPDLAGSDQSDTDNDGLGDICDDLCCAMRADIDHNGVGPDIVDLVYLVTYMFQGGPLVPCAGEADIDGNGEGPDIVDLIHLVTYMFQGGPASAVCP
jgi:M6 family metalloprotease-like protein